jgi:malonyl-CoA/methylmalonyl-CoA synthetase
MEEERVKPGGHFLRELRATFESWQERPAVVYEGRAVAFGELSALAERCAAFLQSQGVQAGDRVVLLTPRKLPFLVACLGVMFSGGIPLPLNPRFTREELRFYLTDSGARVVIAGDEQRTMLAGLVPELPEPPTVVADDAVLDAPHADLRHNSPAADEPCLILYSSGTTGWPKGVVHTQANMASALNALKDCWRLTADDAVVNMLPLFHIHGLVFATLATWLAGGCVRIEEAFDPRQALETIGQGTIFMAVPPMYYRLLDEPGFRNAAKKWNNVRLFTCGSAPIRPEVLPELESILGRPVINRYGMTEAHIITSLPLDGPWPQGTVGLPLAGIELRIATGDGAAAKVGEVGSVLIRGPNLFREYWQNPEATRAAFASGWFDTGDLGSRDERGFLTLVGRKHDLIIVSGYNVYPQVVERVIGECPGVRECAVFGVPDRQRGESVAAAIVRNDLALNEAGLKSWLADRLVHYQQPRKYLFLDALPRNSLGKILRRDLCNLLNPEA